MVLNGDDVEVSSFIMIIMGIVLFVFKEWEGRQSMKMGPAKIANKKRLVVGDMITVLE